MMGRTIGRGTEVNDPSARRRAAVIAKIVSDIGLTSRARVPLARARVPLARHYDNRHEIWTGGDNGARARGVGFRVARARAGSGDVVRDVV